MHPLYFVFFVGIALLHLYTPYSLQCTSHTSHAVGSNRAGIITPVLQMKTGRLCLHITAPHHLVGKQLTSNLEIFLLPLTVPKYRGWFCRLILCDGPIHYQMVSEDNVGRLRKKALSPSPDFAIYTLSPKIKPLNFRFLSCGKRGLHYPSSFLTCLCLRITSRDFCNI